MNETEPESKMNFQGIEEYLIKLDALVSEGWKPTLNNTDAGGWHVGLRHKSAVDPTWGQEFIDGEVVMKTKPQRYHIHATQPTLGQAVDDAIKQVESLISCS